MSTVAAANREPVPRELTREQARDLFDRRVRAEFGMSGDDFIHAWDAGALDADDDRVLALWMILPFGR